MKKIISLRNIVGSFFLLATVFLLAGCSMSKNASEADVKQKATKGSSLSRSDVAKMLLQKTKGEQLYSSIIGGKQEKTYLSDKGWDESGWYFICSSDLNENKKETKTLLEKLEKGGFIEINQDPTERGSQECMEYKFLAGPLTKDNYVVVGEIKDIEVTSMTEPGTDFSGVTVIKGKYTITPKLTEIGKPFFESAEALLNDDGVKTTRGKGYMSNINEEGKGKFILNLNDDGWKVDTMLHNGGYSILSF
jgi:hypothetical protein